MNGMPGEEFSDPVILKGKIQHVRTTEVTTLDAKGHIDKTLIRMEYTFLISEPGTSRFSISRRVKGNSTHQFYYNILVEKDAD